MSEVKLYDEDGDELQFYFYKCVSCKVVFKDEHDARLFMKKFKLNPDYYEPQAIITFDTAPTQGVKP